MWFLVELPFLTVVLAFLGVPNCMHWPWDMPMQQPLGTSRDPTRTRTLCKFIYRSIHLIGLHRLDTFLRSIFVSPTHTHTHTHSLSHTHILVWPHSVLYTIHTFFLRAQWRLDPIHHHSFGRLELKTKHTTLERSRHALLYCTPNLI